MELKELKSVIQDAIESHLLHNLLEHDFKWKKGSLCFQRKWNDFEQSILFFFSPPKYSDDNCIARINIMIRFDSKDVNKVASELKGAINKFDQVDTVINVDVGLVIGSNAIDWRPISIADLNNVFSDDIKPLILNKILPFLDNRGKMQDLINDFENKAKYIFWTSNGEAALRIITMYSILGKKEMAEKIIRKYYLNDEAYKDRYKNVLNYFSIT
jgi:hypothetical protein